MSDNEALHRAAEKRLKEQSGFWRLLGIFVIVWLVLTVIWAVSGGGYFWPGWAMLGMGIALAFIGWSAFGPRERMPSEERIQEEMRRFGE
jgi:uncharacterized ion transporter superfamily protein YfcC